MATTFLLFAFLLIFSIYYLPYAAGDPLFQICGNTGNFTANSTYSRNLNSLLSTLSFNASANGFANATAGSAAPDQVYGLALCRGDTSRADCASCLAGAGTDSQQLCPYSKGATIWYDPCILRYSNQMFLSSTDAGPQAYMWNTQNASDPARFDDLVARLMNSVFNFTAYNSSILFATGDANFTKQVPVIYGLAQCTRDLTRDQCLSCLQRAMRELNGNFKGKQGGRVLGVRCNYRYEVYKFYQGNSSFRLQLPPTSPPPTNGSSPPGRVPPAAASEEQGGKKNSTGKVIAIVVPLVIALVLIVSVCICFCKRKSPKKVPVERNSDEITTVESLLFDLSTVRNATDNFSDANKLGEGGFGVVYKGLLMDGREIAVKRLSTRSGQGLEELKNELVLVAKLQHRNLVRLLGVCMEEDEKLLVYEYVPNRSLDTFLFDNDKREQLSWGIRYRIIGGIARGLLYLHEDSQLKIVHRDLKASNVLLDSDMNPKISDFGLARLFGGDQTQEITSRVVGTYGYMAPEYAMRGHFSTKSDAYSFGVLVLEIITGKKNSDFNSEVAEDLLSYAWNYWTNGRIIEIVDPLLGEHYPRSEVLRCIHIAMLCVQEDPYDRPNMSTVVLMLNSYSVSLHAPSKPAFCAGKTGKYSDMLSNEFDPFRNTQEHSQSTTKSIPMTPNEVSISELEPR